MFPPTASILEAEVREPPDVAQPDGVGDAGHGEVELAAPGPALVLPGPRFQELALGAELKDDSLLGSLVIRRSRRPLLARLGLDELGERLLLVRGNHHLVREVSPVPSYFFFF